MLPEDPPTPRSLPLREQVTLAQRIAVARAVAVPWREIVEAEGMAERTLRYHLRRWEADLKREREPTDVLLRASCDRARCARSRNRPHI